QALAAQEKPADAEAYYRQALRLNPKFAEAHNGLGNVLQSLERLDEAVAQIRQALQLKPDFAEAHNNLGNALLRQEKKDEAASHYREALRLRPDYGEVHNNLGALMLAMNKPEVAETHCRQALRLRPEFAEGHNNLGNALLRLGKLPEAVECFRKAVRLKPGFAEAHNNLGTAIKDLGQVEEGLAILEHALTLKPDYTEAHWNRSLAWLLQGDFERGWNEYEWRWQRPDFAWRRMNKPLWDGTEIAGRTILIQSEQGLGDTIQFIRYAKLVKERGGTVIFECQAPLMKLLSGVEGIDRLVARGSPLPPYDFQVQLLGLPRIFHTTEATIPRQIPYLDADPALVEKWRVVSDEWQGKADHSPLLVGIAWQGNPAQVADRQRSIPLAKFAAFAKIPGVQLISLQKGPGSEQLQAASFPVMDLGSRLDESAGPFMDTAAVMKNLDLVISSDTAIPHLAGALGVPVWVALPVVPDWRWLLRREDSPWYSTMRLFRQSEFGRWEDVFERMADALQRLPTTTTA
ncbi:MAG TPA: tetratricopeptide repeat protein, partial [Gemmataceae bacterium]|nr:tetratricopeptide repeat protein [Gemmataceae bacterium]